jgi:hypothetical protein
MFGPDISKPEDKGIIPRACAYVQRKTYGLEWVDD